jgi:CheY-like chemotaxis protein
MNAGTHRDEASEHNLAEVLAPHLPYLRRFGRALTGTQAAGDGLVAALLEALIEDREAFDHTLPPRVAAFNLLHTLWEAKETVRDRHRGDARDAARELRQARAYLLLTTLEELTTPEAARVVGAGPAEAERLQGAAPRALSAERTARVLVIEDEPIIALDLRSIVEGLGHTVVGTADTHRTAVDAATETDPDLVLADIKLADGSSGIDAVREILERHTVPVIFITAYPERLLTGERPEPTYLVTKPFRQAHVEAVIAQALFNADRA